jgi:CDP-diacylglycerol--serine O-phosphatidyltransferase
MPTPANALFWASLLLVMRDLHEKGIEHIQYILFHPAIIAALCVLFSALLVLPIRMFSFKFKTTDFMPNWQQFTLILIILGLYFFIGIGAIPIGILLYPLLSLTLRK